MLNNQRRRIVAFNFVATFSNNSTHSGSWAILLLTLAADARKKLPTSFIRRSTADGPENHYWSLQTTQTVRWAASSQKRSWKTAELNENPVRIMQQRSLGLGQRDASSHRMQQRRLQWDEVLSLHENRALMVLKTFRRCDGQTWELGKKCDANPPQMRWRASRLLILNIHVNANHVFLDPQSEIVH